MEMIGARGGQNGVVQVPNLLLQKFFITSNHFCSRNDSEAENGEDREEVKKEEEEKDLELSLGLSLNGQFGTDLARSRKRKNFELSRSSSIPEGFVFDEQRSGDGGDMRRNTVRPVMFQLDRTRSLPVVTEMEMETKRNRSEKTRAFLEFPKEKNRIQADHGGKDGFTLSSGGNGETAKTRAFMEFQVSPTKEQTKHAKKDGFTLSPGHNGETTKKRVIMKFQVSTAKEEAEHARKDGFTLSPGSNNERKNTRAFLEFQIPPKKEETNHIRKDGFTLNHKSNEKTRALMEFPVPSAKKVTDHSQKDGFTLSPGSNGKTEKTRTFMDFQVPLKKEETVHSQKDGFTPTSVNDKGKNGNTLPPRKKKKKKNAEVSGMEKARNFLEDMPCVSTREVGADGKRVEGFLYWYGGNKEEVKIVCVCHGSFLSPVEFVKHGGVTVKEDGDDVTMNPLRHIVVKLSSSSL